jgi:hypothetical protein
MYCPPYANATSCYFLNTVTGSYTTQKTACASMGGYLAAFNSAFEQLDVEVRFRASGALSSADYYYIGLEKIGNLWYWPDGEPFRWRCLQFICCA